MLLAIIDHLSGSVLNRTGAESKVVLFFLQAQKVSDDLLQKIGSKNRRALDLVAAKCYYYHARVYEFLNQFDSMRRYKTLDTHLTSSRS